MFKLIHRKISIKLLILIVGVVAVATMFLFVYLNNINTKRMLQSLDYTISSTSKLLETAYENPLWNYSKSDVAGFSTDILNVPEVIAINVYDLEGFFSGYKKEYTKSGFIEKEIFQPFKLSKEKKYIKKTVQIKNDIDDIGIFEIFYTEKFIKEANRKYGIKMGFCFLILAVIIIIVSHITIKFLVVIPVITLSEQTKAIAKNKDYSLSIERLGTDEIANLYNGFNNMLKQIRKKDAQREESLLSLKKSDENYNYMFTKLKDAVNNGDYSRVEILNDEKDKNHAQELIISLNTFLDTLESYDKEAKERDWLKTGQTTLGNAIGGEIELERLCANAITHISEYLNIQVGVIYIKNDIHKNCEKNCNENSDSEFIFCAGYALKEHKKEFYNFKIGEGIAGQAALRKKSMVITDVPDNYLEISSTLGRMLPQNILVLPLIYEDDVKGVVELGSITTFSPTMIEFVQLSADIVAVAVNAALVNKKLKIVLEHTKEQSIELQSSQEVLENKNKELEEQALILRKSEVSLQVQKEELQATNEEMEEKNELLESRKDEIEQKDIDLEKTRVNIEEKAAQLELATRYRAEFFANMSHELRTPLNSMLLLARMLAENEDNNLLDDQIESAVSINKSGLGLLRLINDILDLSKIEAKKIDLNISCIPIDDLLSNLKQEFKHVALKQGLKFNIIMEEGLPERITTDSLRVEQMVRNLLGNAFKFTEYGEVLVKVFRPAKKIQFNREDLISDNTIAISIMDTGVGIPSDKIQLIFEAFRQVDGSISRKHGGTGLGLSISRELIALLGGELKVESKLGKGTTFTIYLPEILKSSFSNENSINLLIKDKATKFQKEVVKCNESIPSAKLDNKININKTDFDKTDFDKTDFDKTNIDKTNFDKTNFDKTNIDKTNIDKTNIDKTNFDKTDFDKTDVVKSKPDKDVLSMNKTSENIMDKKDLALPGKKIMIADADMRNAFTLKRFLTEKEMEVTIINNGNKLFELLKPETKPDIFLISNKMPKMDDYEIIKTIKNDDTYNSIPIISFTTTATEKESEQSIKAGANDYLHKPIDTQKLLSMLKVWLYQ